MQLQTVATSGDADEVKQLIEDQVKNALHPAAKHGHVTLVRVLIGAYAVINLQDKVLWKKRIDL